MSRRLVGHNTQALPRNPQRASCELITCFGKESLQSILCRAAAVSVPASQLALVPSSPGVRNVRKLEPLCRRGSCLGELESPVRVMGCSSHLSCPKITPCLSCGTNGKAIARLPRFSLQPLNTRQGDGVIWEQCDASPARARRHRHPV